MNKVLVHHGIKGQKWGIRNGPPYPIEDKVLKKGTRINSIGYGDSAEARRKSNRWSYEKQDFVPYKFESTNPNVEILGDAPGGEIALRRRPKKADPVADAKAAQKRKDDLARSEIQDLKDAYKLTGDRSFLNAAKDRERKLKRGKSK